MEVNKLWKNNDINKYYIISLDKETNEWKFFREIVGHTVFWKDEPSRYGMTKSKAVEVLNIVKSLTKEDIKSEPTEPTEGESGTEAPTNSTENEGTTTTTDNTSGETSGDTPTEPSESNTGSPTNTSTETPTGENNNGETPSEGNTEPNNGNETNTNPVTHVEEPSTPTPTEPQYKIITISSVTYNSTEVAIFDDDDYNKLKSTLTYIDSTYPNTVVHIVTKSDTGKSIFYFYLEDELTWFLELRTNIDYSLVNHVTTLDNIKELL